MQMARNTRSGHNEVPPPPPPPPPMPVELLATIVEGQRMLNEAMQTMAQQNRGGRHVRQGGEANQHSSFKDFQDTKPPVFKEAVEPLEADEWLNTLEQKFRLLRVTEELKAEYAAHQLEGKAGVWWSPYRTSLPANAVVTWDLFKTAFRNTYIPQGLMTIKHTEFMNLTQETKSLTVYLHAFNNLSRYAPEMVDTEVKKLASFKRGLGPKLSKNMAGNKSTTFNEFVSDALTQENSNAVYAASKNRKRAYEVGASQSKAPVTSKPAYRSPNAVTRYRPPQKKSNVKTGVRKSFTVALPRGATGQEVPRLPLIIVPALTANKLVTGRGIALIPRGILQLEVITVLAECITPLLKKFLKAKWSPLVCFLSIKTLQLSCLILELRIHL